MKDLKHGLALPISRIACLVILGTQVFAQELPKDITIEALAKDNKRLCCINFVNHNL